MLNNWGKSEIHRDAGRVKEEMRMGSRWWKKKKGKKVEEEWMF